MCGRFTASFEFREIKLLFNVQRDCPSLSPRYNIAPSQEVPVIVQNDGGNELKRMKWGLVPYWAPDPSIGTNMINASAEIITENRAIAGSSRASVVLFPQMAFMSGIEKEMGKFRSGFTCRTNSRSRSLVFGIRGGMSMAKCSTPLRS
jgi:putative SOS response-associated peptidase YedK